MYGTFTYIGVVEVGVCLGRQSYGSPRLVVSGIENPESRILRRKTELSVYFDV